MEDKELPAEYPEFSDDDEPIQDTRPPLKPSIDFENISFSNLTELPNCTATQRALIPQHLLDKKKEPVRMSWLPNLGISDAIQKAKERGEQIANERRIAQGLPPLPLSSASTQNANGTTSVDKQRIHGHPPPEDTPLPPSTWMTRGKPESPISQKPMVEKVEVKQEVVSEVKQEINSNVNPETRQPNTTERNRESKPTTVTEPELVKKVELERTSESQTEKNKRSSTVKTVGKPATRAADKTSKGQRPSIQDDIDSLTSENNSVGTKSDLSLEKTATNAAKEAAVRAIADATKAAADASAAASQMAADAKANMRNWLGGTKKVDDEKVLPEDSLHGDMQGGGLFALLSAGTQNQSGMEHDDMSYGTTQSSQQAFSNPRAHMQRMNSSMSQSVHHMNLAPDEVETKERRPWRRESELRSGSMIAGKKGRMGGFTAAAAAIVAMQHHDWNDSESSDKVSNAPPAGHRGSLLGIVDDEDSTSSEVLYDLPSELDHSHTPPKNFLDAWREQETAAQESKVDDINKEYFEKMEQEVEEKAEKNVLNIWGSFPSKVPRNAEKRPDLSLFATNAFPSNAMETVDESTKSKKHRTTKKKSIEIEDQRDSLKPSLDLSERSASRANKKGTNQTTTPSEFDRNTLSRSSSADNFDHIEKGKKTKKKSKDTSDLLVREPTERKKGQRTQVKKVDESDTESGAHSSVGGKKSKKKGKKKDIDEVSSFFFDDYDNEYPTVTSQGIVKKWPTLKKPERTQSAPAPIPQLGHVKVMKRFPSSDTHQLLTAQNFVKQGSMTSNTSDSTPSSKDGIEKGVNIGKPSMLDRLEQQSRATTLTSLFGSKPVENEAKDIHCVTLGSKNTMTLIRMSSAHHMGPTAVDPVPLQLSAHESIQLDEQEKSLLHKAPSFRVQKSRGIFGFGKKKQTEHMSLDDHVSDDGELDFGTEDDMDKPVETSNGGKFRRRMSGGGTMPTINMPKLGFGGKKHLEDKVEVNEDGFKQQIRRASLGGTIQKQAPKSKTDSQPLMLERQTSGNWGNLEGSSSGGGMDLESLHVVKIPTPPIKPEGNTSLFVFRKKSKVPNPVDEQSNLSRTDGKFRSSGLESDGELDFNPRHQTEKAAKSIRPRRSTSLPRPKSSKGGLDTNISSSDDFGVLKKKTDGEKNDKPRKPKRRKSVEKDEIPETPIAEKKIKDRRGAPSDAVPETPPMEKKKKDRHGSSGESSFGTPLSEKKQKSRRKSSNDCSDGTETPVVEKKKKKERSETMKSEKESPSEKKRTVTEKKEKKERRDTGERIETSKSMDDRGEKSKDERKSKNSILSPTRIRPLVPPPRFTPPPAALSGKPPRCTADDPETKTKKKKAGRRMSS